MWIDVIQYRTEVTAMHDIENVAAIDFPSQWHTHTHQQRVARERQRQQLSKNWTDSQWEAGSGSPTTIFYKHSPWLDQIIFMLLLSLRPNTTHTTNIDRILVQFKHTINDIPCQDITKSSVFKTLLLRSLGSKLLIKTRCNPIQELKVRSLTQIFCIFRENSPIALTFRSSLPQNCLWIFAFSFLESKILYWLRY